MSLERLQQFTKPRFLLCEGEADKGFFEALIAGRGLPDFQVYHSAQCNPEKTGGLEGFAKALGARRFEALSGWRDLKALLLITDNDTVGPSFAAAQRALTDNSYTAPATPDGIGDMAGKPVAILMIPNQNVAGDLETLCLPTIHERWPTAQACVDAFLQCTGANAWQKCSSINKARARSAVIGFHEPDPYHGIGVLFKKGILSVGHGCFDPLVQYFQNFDAMCGLAP